MINSQPSSDRCADIAAALHTLALRFTDLIGSGVPVRFVQINIHPGHYGDDESVVAAVDAVTEALLGHAGQVEDMTGGNFHYNNGDGPEPIGPVGVRIFNAVTPEYAAKRAAAEHLPDPAPEEPECTPECDALYTNITKTGGDRQWHHDECPWAKILDDGPKWTFELGGAS